MIDAPPQRRRYHAGNGSNGSKPAYPSTWLDRRRSWLRTWLPPVLHDVLAAPPSREFLLWLWGRKYELGGLSPAENWLILHTALVCDIGPCDLPNLRGRLNLGLSGTNEVPVQVGDIVSRAIDALERRPGYIRPKDLADTEFEELIAWLDGNPL